MQHIKRRKVIAVGDDTVGKTCFLVRFIRDKFIEDTRHRPVEDFHWTDVMVDGKDFEVAFWDTFGRDEDDSMRHLGYPDTDIFFLCFSIASPTSFANIKAKWVPEIRHYCPNTPFILVGTKRDLRGAKPSDPRRDLREATSTEPSDTQRDLRGAKPSDPRRDSREATPTEPSDAKRDLREATPTESSDAKRDLREATPTESSDTQRDLREATPTESSDAKRDLREATPTESSDTQRDLREATPTEPSDAKRDLRGATAMEPSEEFVDTSAAHQMAKETGAVGYFETSALTGEGVADTVTAALRVVQSGRRKFTWPWKKKSSGQEYVTNVSESDRKEEDSSH